jgi:hypothetical protein
LRKLRLGPSINFQLNMQFEVLATCHTTRARASRMSLSREFAVDRHKSSVILRPLV